MLNVLNTNLVHPDASRAPNSISSPPVKAYSTGTPLVVCNVPDANEDIKAPSIAPNT